MKVCEEDVGPLMEDGPFKDCGDGVGPLMGGGQIQCSSLIICKSLNNQTK